MVCFFTPITSNSQSPENYRFLRHCNNYFSPVFGRGKQIEIISHDQLNNLTFFNHKTEPCTYHILRIALTVASLFTILIPTLALIGTIIYHSGNNFIPSSHRAQNDVALVNRLTGEIASLRQTNATLNNEQEERMHLELQLKSCTNSIEQLNRRNQELKKQLKDSLNSYDFCQMDKTESLHTYLQKYCPGFSLDAATTLAQAGANNFRRILADEITPEDLFKRENPELFVTQSIWHLMLKAEEKGQAFFEGTFGIEDLDGKLFNFWNQLPLAYSRWSSHIKKITIKDADGTPINRGIDINKTLKEMGFVNCESPYALPAEKATVLFIPYEIGGKRMLFIKPETHGLSYTSLSGILSAAGHLFDFAGKFLWRQIYTDADRQAGMHKERIAKADVQRFISVIEPYFAAMENVVTSGERSTLTSFLYENAPLFYAFELGSRANSLFRTLSREGIDQATACTGDAAVLEEYRQLLKKYKDYITGEVDAQGFHLMAEFTKAIGAVRGGLNPDDPLFACKAAIVKTVDELLAGNPVVGDDLLVNDKLVSDKDYAKCRLGREVIFRAEELCIPAQICSSNDESASSSSSSSSTATC